MRATAATFKLGISFENWARDGDRYIHSFGSNGKPTWMCEFHHFWLRSRELGVAVGTGRLLLRAAGREGRQVRDSRRRRDQLRLPLRCRPVREIPAPLRRSARHQARRRQDPRGQADTANRVSSKRWCCESGQVDRRRSVHRLHRLSRPADRADAEDRVTRTGPTGCRATAPPPCRPSSIGAGAAVSRAPSRTRRAGAGAFRCSTASATAWCSAASFLATTSAKAELLARHRRQADHRRRACSSSRPGRRRQVWNKNCVALGLASGFIEPLESTSIHLMMIGVTRLMHLFPFGGITQPVVDQYNEAARARWRRRATSSSCTTTPTQRDDSRLLAPLPRHADSRIRWRIASSCSGRRAYAYQGDSELFRVDSWTQVMLGQRITPRTYHPAARILVTRTSPSTWPTFARRSRRPSRACRCTRIS